MTEDIVISAVWAAYFNFHSSASRNDGAILILCTKYMGYTKLRTLRNDGEYCHFCVCIAHGNDKIYYHYRLLCKHRFT
ncbi:MAG: hypothetical protein LBP54_02815 [Campylobacteraceae bacterium]|jgi:hypothetical protein|nr:hypothetical protein [Campylobacteraceae bacterium]